MLSCNEKSIAVSKSLAKLSEGKEKLKKDKNKMATETHSLWVTERAKNGVREREREVA